MGGEQAGGEMIAEPASEEIVLLFGTIISVELAVIMMVLVMRL